MLFTVYFIKKYILIYVKIIKNEYLKWILFSNNKITKHIVVLLQDSMTYRGFIDGYWFV
jgi:hypothetical protein